MEEAHTGGLKSFVYSGEEEDKLDPELEKKIDDAYERYYKKKRLKKIFWVSAIILVLLIIGYIVLL